MTGATIDHMVSVTILIAALLVAMLTYSNLFATAIDYDLNRQVATKASDIMNTICLSPGSPTDWGETNASVLGFGLQDPQEGGYAVSPYSVMRLKTSPDSELLEYPPGSGVFYNNISAYFGDAILTPLGDCLNYTTATELLGINGTYGFSVDITPTLDVSISKVSGYSHLVFEVDVTGSGLPLIGATLNYYMFHIGTNPSAPKITTYSGVNQTNSFGSAVFEFGDIDGDEGEAYHFMVYAHLGGLSGVGYYSQDDLDDYPQYVVPLINDYDEGIIMIAHSWGVHNYTETPVPAVTYNATFYALTSDFQLQQIEIENSTASLNYGSKDYETTQLPTSEVGFLFISYRWNNKLGSVVLPWGLGTLGVSASYGGDSAGYDFVATEIRQVSIDDISYHVKVSTWKLGS